MYRDQNGKIHKRQNYQDGIKDGIFEFYSPTTNCIKVTGYYFNDKRVGTWQYFDNKGKVSSTRCYD